MLDAEVNKFEAVYRELSAGEITSQWITEGYYKKYYKMVYKCPELSKYIPPPDAISA